MTGHLQEVNRSITGSVQTKKGNLYVVLNLYDEAGKRKPKWIPTGLPERGNKRAAEKLKEEYIARYTAQLLSPLPKGALFSDYALGWLENRKGENGLEMSTWENYENVTKNHIVPYFKKQGLAVSEVTPRHIRDYFNYKAKSGRLDGKKGGLAYDTLKKHSSVLQLIFADAVILEEVTRNPALSVKPIKPIADDDADDFEDVVFLNQEEGNRVINAFEGEILQPIIFVCLYYGLRRSEVLGLKWDAIDFEQDTLSIKSTVVKHKTTVEKDRTKTKKSKATYALLPEVKELLLRLRDEQRNNRKLFGKKYVKSDYVFTWQDGHLIRPDYVTQRFQKVLEKKGFPAMRFHDLRHSCASILYDRGWNVKDIQEWLRHSNIKTTMNIYTHLSERRKKILTKSLENTFHIIRPVTDCDFKAV